MQYTVDFLSGGICARLDSPLKQNTFTFFAQEFLFIGSKAVHNIAIGIGTRIKTVTKNTLLYPAYWFNSNIELSSQLC